MINCIAVDDEPRALEIIERYCNRHEEIRLLSIFREPVKALEFLKQEKADLVFLDINMPGKSGIQFVSTLQDKPLIIFTTAYHEYAVESYNLDAVDYLVKPITFERFSAAVNKALNLIFLKNKARERVTLAGVVFFKSGAQTHQVKIGDIQYLEKEGNYIAIHLKDRKILVRENMS
ncbi:MAG: response regulator, partial [Ferruginibacter sp.]